MYKSFVLLMALLLQFSLADAENRTPADYVDPVTGMEFVAVPGGTFQMGSADYDRASPVHEVAVKPFLLGRYEVTREQYVQFCSNTGRLFSSAWLGDNGVYPITDIAWQDAVDFTEWLSEKAGRVYRLPSESEWEFAALGGKQDKFPWGNDVGENNANCKGCGSRWDGISTAPVGSFSANAYGLYDVSGNVYEFCQDDQHDDYRGAPADGSAWFSPGGTYRVITRGGSWRDVPEDIVIKERCWLHRETTSSETGFRVLLEY